MKSSTVGSALRRAVAQLRTGLVNEDGQAATEYSLITFYLVVSGTASIFAWMPAMLNAYTIYIHGFYTVLGLPVP